MKKVAVERAPGVSTATSRPVDPAGLTFRRHSRQGLLAPDAEMWQALDHGRKLTEILRDFYKRVYADPALSVFFEGVTQERAVEKQYSFLRSIFTGERCYFGEHPKNAHHWMVISNALFDHREALMEQCLKAAAMPEALIDRWLAIEEVFRKSIVKEKAYGKMVGGTEVPFKGYGWLRLDVATLCDGCAAEIATNTSVAYHRRTGKVYCASCKTPKQQNA